MFDVLYPFYIYLFFNILLIFYVCQREVGKEKFLDKLLLFHFSVFALKSDSDIYIYIYICIENPRILNQYKSILTIVFYFVEYAHTNNKLDINYSEYIIKINNRYKTCLKILFNIT